MMESIQKKRRYVKIIKDGTSYIDDLLGLVSLLKYCDIDDSYIIRPAEMTEKEFANLPEFKGF